MAINLVEGTRRASALVAAMLALCSLAAATAVAGAQPVRGRRPHPRASVRHVPKHRHKIRRTKPKHAKHHKQPAHHAPVVEAPSPPPASSSPPLTGTPVLPTATTLTGSPLVGLRWYVNPYSSAANQQAAWQQSNPAAAAAMGKIASQPMAAWFPNSTSNVTAAVNARVNLAAPQNATAQLVAYDIPLRDCGGYSRGGATSPSAYQTWINGFAAGIGSHKAVVVLEPDALAGLGCLSAADQATRLSLLADAVSVLAAHPGVYVYIDAGHEGWQTPAVMAQRLQQAGVAHAQGFALNVDNFYSVSTEEAYGQSISALVGGKHFVIDTSRSGKGSNGQWCNPSGRGLGMPPTAATGNALTDAFLWIKTPGVSDGSCNGGPLAGTWWPAYALGLAQNAAF
jgi:endoglucanase